MVLQISGTEIKQYNGIKIDFIIKRLKTEAHLWLESIHDTEKNIYSRVNHQQVYSSTK